MSSQHDELEELFWGSKLNEETEKDSEPVSWSTMMLIMILFALSALVGFGAAKVYYTHKQDMTISKTLPAFAGGKNNLNILVLGTDERKGEQQARSDTILLVSIDTAANKVCVLSLPRDTYVKIPGVRYKTKLNHAYALGGPELTSETLQQLLGTKIDYYLATNFEGFEKIIDALGGIDINVEKRMYYPAEGIDLKQGEQHLDGKKALMYVRFRSDGLGDIGRIGRQQKFLHAVAEKILTPAGIAKLPTLAGIIKESVHTNMDAAAVLALLKHAKAFDTKALTTDTIPGEPQYINGVSYWLPDVYKAKQLLRQTEESGRNENGN